MRLDHVSYATSHEQISDVVNRIGSQIGTSFVDGGIHPRFGTRNFTAPLLNGQYIEVVCPMDHPATDSTPFGKAVKKKVGAGGGWLTWVISIDDIEEMEKALGRKSVIGNRKKPDGSELEWKQLGVLDTLEDFQKPFFVQWLTEFHPSKDGSAVSGISNVKISGDHNNVAKFARDKLNLEKIKVDWVNPESQEMETGIISVIFNYGDLLVTIK
jgi:hypothetical protein